MHKFFSFLVSISLFASCTNSETATSTTDTTVEAPATETSPITVKNTKLVLKDKGEFPLPVYDTFDEIESIFHVDNDTTYIINFWATWCKPCVAELPYFEQIQENYKDKKVKVVLVSLDFKKLISHKLVPFIEKHNIQSSVVLLADPKASTWIDKVSTEWDGAIPVTIIYKGNNRKFIGHEVQDYYELDYHLNEVLRATS